MKKNESCAEELLPVDTLNILIEAWNTATFDKSNGLIKEQFQLTLVNKDKWQLLKPDELFALCRRWKQEYLENRSDKNAGSLEWLFCILRHNATNYDFILAETTERHAWAPGFGSLLRLRADYMIISYLRERHLLEELVRKCQIEWMWKNC